MLLTITRFIRESVAAPVVLMAVGASTISGIAIRDATDLNNSILTAVLATIPVLIAALMQYIAARNATELRKTQMMIDADILKAKIEAKATVAAASVLAQAKTKAESTLATALVKAEKGEASPVLLSSEGAGR